VAVINFAVSENLFRINQKVSANTLVLGNSPKFMVLMAFGKIARFLSRLAKFTPVTRLQLSDTNEIYS